MRLADLGDTDATCAAVRDYRVSGSPGLVLVPTRELAIQVHRSRRMTPQRDALRRGVDIVVATPGRLIDRRLLPAPLEEVVGSS